VHKPGEHDEIRTLARRFEEALPGEKRKRLGQFFTGVPLGKLLAHLALTADTHAVLDPMAGHGDLLDASKEAAFERGIDLQRLDGVEIDEDTARFCRDRLSKVTGSTKALGHTIVCGSAFDHAVLKELQQPRYDLAITNPPYVRYQSQNVGANPGETVRAGLAAVIDRAMDGNEKSIWQALAHGYSGLADLSVPAWILSALMVRPEGRLALVVPATWRSREYGDIVRYLLLRCFQLECIVEDTQPGWFSDALVRTHLIVARRLPAHEIAEPLTQRTAWPSARWIQITPEAADSRSLVGTAFADAFPEAALAKWLHTGATGSRPGIQVRAFHLDEEWASLQSRAVRRPWCRQLEPDYKKLPLFSDSSVSAVPVPDVIRDIVGDKPALTTLEQAGIRTGQGLRTGCNWFFYVDACGFAAGNLPRVRASEAFGNQEFAVPATALRPVLRRQSELPHIESGRPPPGRVLDLREWILPEDADAVAEAKETYRKRGEMLPTVMPDELAHFVRRAAVTPVDDEGGKCVPDLSAVRTNVRAHRSGVSAPRFWYMLPDFAARHQPAAFVARINHGAPSVECNLDDPVLIDANFSTFWLTGEDWTRFGVKALLNSALCQVLMEALGTPMGGGALKLEAVHIRQLPIPQFGQAARDELDRLGRKLSGNDAAARINFIVLNALCNGTEAEASAKAARIAERAETLRRMRLRTAA